MFKLAVSRWLVNCAESCGWLLDFDERYIASFLTRPASQGAVRTSDSDKNDTRGRSTEINWRIYPEPTYHYSMEHLTWTDDVHRIVDELVGRLRTSPDTTESVSHDIKYIKAEATEIDGRHEPRIVIAYRIEPETHTVVLINIFDVEDMLRRREPLRSESNIA